MWTLSCATMYLDACPKFLCRLLYVRDSSKWLDYLPDISPFNSSVNNHCIVWSLHMSLALVVSYSCDADGCGPFSILKLPFLHDLSLSQVLYCSSMKLLVHKISRGQERWSFPCKYSLRIKLLVAVDFIYKFDCSSYSKNLCKYTNT